MQTPEEKLKAAKNLIDFLWKNATMSKVKWVQAQFYLDIFHDDASDGQGEEIIPVGAEVRITSNDSIPFFHIGKRGTVMDYNAVSDAYVVVFGDHSVYSIPSDKLEVIP